MLEISASSCLTVSVVTPSFNQGCFLAQTMESVLSQEGDFLLDYLVVDGGSTDESLEVIRRYEEAIDSGCHEIRCAGIRFRWVSERDNGQADAIAKGFRMATGDILCWLNSDDIFYPGALQIVAGHFAADEECGCLYGRTMYTDEDGTFISEYPTQTFDLSILPVRNFICQPATFFKRSAYEAVGGVDPTLRYSMDYDLWIRMTKVARFCYLPELLATYRLHTQSKSVSPAESVANHAEGLATTVRHFGWAPVSKVYGYCSFFALHSLPAPFNRVKLIRGIVAAMHTVFKYLHLNQGINLNDLRVLSLTNIWKFLSGWEDVPVKAGKTKESPKGQAE